MSEMWIAPKQTVAAKCLQQVGEELGTTLFDGHHYTV